MGVMTVNAVAIGAGEITRLGYVTDSLDGEIGIGVVASIFAVCIPVSSVVAGRNMDVRDPRPFLVGSIIIGGGASLTTAWVLGRGPMPLGWLVAITALDAITIGTSMTALLKVQAATVRPGARGRAETVNILRNGVGGAIGTVVAGFIADDVTTLVLSGAITVTVGAATAAIVAPVSIPDSLPVQRRLKELVSAVRNGESLRRTVSVNLILATVLPSQFLALVITDRDAPAVATTAFAASLLGVLVGRLALMVRGLRGNPTRRLRATYLGFTALCAVSILMLTSDWLLDRTVLLTVMVFAGSVLVSFTEKFPIALLQQQVPEELRWSLSGAIIAARSLIIGAAAAAFTWLTYVHNATVLTVAVTATLAAGYLLAGRFQGLTTD
jgi:MFS family permease